MKSRQAYEKPAVIFEKHLEAMASDCQPGGSDVYTGSVPGFCKDGGCIGYQFS